MLKVAAFYLTVSFSIYPLVAIANETGTPETIADKKDLRPLIKQLAQQCAPLPKSLDTTAQKHLQAFYDLVEGQPVWTDSAQLQQLSAQINLLADDGLNPANYPIPLLSQTPVKKPDCADLLSSHSYVQALTHLRKGRTAPARSETLWRNPALPAANLDLAGVSIAVKHIAAPEKAFSEARPASPRYQNLRKAYAALRQLPQHEWPTLKDGKLLKPKGSDNRLPTLRKRLIAEGYLAANAESDQKNYDDATRQALEQFQREHGLNPDGVLGPASIRELNIPAQQRLDQLRANLERLRWQADDLKITQVLINVPASELLVLKDEAELWRTRTQVGRNDRKTPLLISKLNRLTLNPTWTVPPTILKKDKLPVIRNDLGYLERNKMAVLDSAGHALNPELVDWENPGNIMLRMAAGKGNPLGRMAFRFENPFAVYLHDTPSQNLFSKAPRAFSSGCVRVESVDSFLNWLLSPEEQESVKTRLASGKTQQFQVGAPSVLMMTYWTAEADGNGALTYYPDIYNQDKNLIQALNTAMQ